jgi:hypothetical protein
MIAFVLVVGRRSRRGGATGDLAGLDEVDLAPVSAPL